MLLVFAVACSSPAAPAPTSAPPTAGGLADKPAPSASSAAAATVRIAQAPGVGNAPAYLADAHGYFREQGIKAEFVRVGSSPELQQLVSTGDAEIGFGGLSAAFFNGLARDLDMRIIAGNYQTDPEGNSQLPIVARRASVDSGEIKTIADLK